MLAIETRAQIERLGDDVLAASVREIFRANLARLLDERKADGLTQAEFAARLGVLAQKVSQWKAGAFPRPDQIDRIAEALGVSVEELFKPPTTTELPVSDREVDILLRELARARGYDLTRRS